MYLNRIKSLLKVLNSVGIVCFQSSSHPFPGLARACPAAQHLARRLNAAVLLLATLPFLSEITDASLALHVRRVAAEYGFLSADGIGAHSFVHPAPQPIPL